MTSPKIGEFCDSAPPAIVTTTNEILVHFYTNDAYTDTGFKMMYSPSSNQGGGGSGGTTTPSGTTNAGGCNQGWIADGYCDDINNNLACTYDGGDCCGSNVNTQFCTECQCLE